MGSGVTELDTLLDTLKPTFPPHILMERRNETLKALPQDSLTT